MGSLFRMEKSIDLVNGSGFSRSDLIYILYSKAVKCKVDLLREVEHPVNYVCLRKVFNIYLAKSDEIEEFEMLILNTESDFMLDFMFLLGIVLNLYRLSVAEVAVFFEIEMVPLTGMSPGQIVIYTFKGGVEICLPSSLLLYIKNIMRVIRKVNSKVLPPLLPNGLSN